MSIETVGPAREPVGWCHGCGTVQLKSDMPAGSVPWSDESLPMCVECEIEPWGMGVWPKGEHLPGCWWHDSAAIRTVAWTLVETCTCR